MAINLASGTSFLTFSASGSITLNDTSGSNFNNADGVGAATSSSYETGYGSISGLTAPNAGFLTGVFLTSTGPSGAAPSALDFNSTSFSSLSPLLDQTFSIGEGKTGDGTGATQTFYIPTSATELYLGISDACSYSGSPSGYADNSGAFTVNVSSGTSSPPVPPSAVPEPSSLALLGTGALGTFASLRRRFARH